MGCGDARYEVGGGYAVGIEAQVDAVVFAVGDGCVAVGTGAASLLQATEVSYGSTPAEGRIVR